MGIVNVTPDSFSDGGNYLDPQRAIAHALTLLDEGADILDIGGESTRPGAEPVSRKDELARVLPVIDGILDARPDTLISIDTTKAEVARQSLEHGADIINDFSAKVKDADMVHCAADTSAPIVLMHMRGTPKTMQQDTHYSDLMGEQLDYFRERIDYAVAHGVRHEHIILDPGIGFGKSTTQNCELIQRLDEFSIFGLMLLLGTSRKSFIGHILGKPTDERAWGTAASVAIGVMNGAHILRVHDVAQMRDVAHVARMLTHPEQASHLP